MARPKDREKALKLRFKGLSYSQIKSEMGLSKSTLSGWLKDYPLSDEQIKKLRDFSPQRIEKCRNTKAQKVKNRLEEVYNKITLDIGVLSEREIFIAGLFLYWGEGSKSERVTTGLSNTDPAMLRFFIKWVKILNVEDKKLHATLQLYTDMNVENEIKFWSKELGLAKNLFKKPYIKESTLAGLTYKRGFGHGTCNLRIFNRDLAEYVHMAMKRLSLMDFR
ncbi:MAG: helix-turn-helix domain containing protein [Candidatus Zambryskibacteria bacterium]|nr:helix-turn-helix domain containing protein [Candidatus Zambryskibacteria bacterium]